MHTHTHTHTHGSVKTRRAAIGRGGKRAPAGASSVAPKGVGCALRCRGGTLFAHRPHAAPPLCVPHRQFRASAPLQSPRCNAGPQRAARAGVARPGRRLVAAERRKVLDSQPHSLENLRRHGENSTTEGPAGSSGGGTSFTHVPSSPGSSTRRRLDAWSAMTNPREGVACSGVRVHLHQEHQALAARSRAATAHPPSCWHCATASTKNRGRVAASAEGAALAKGRAQRGEEDRARVAVASCFLLTFHYQVEDSVQPSALRYRRPCLSLSSS